MGIIHCNQLGFEPLPFCIRKEWLLLPFYSIENGEKTEKPEPEPEVKEEEPEMQEEVTVKAKAKKEKKPAEEGFELWNELEVQRIKFMVSPLVLRHQSNFKTTRFIV